MVAAKPVPPARVLDFRALCVEVTLPRGWDATVSRQQDYILFQYADKPALTTQATIALFQIWVPVAARHRSREEIAASYATQDKAGFQQALFKSNAGLRALNRKPELWHGGQVFLFAEPIDVSGRRLSSTTFVRGWVFFPGNFADSGTLFLLLGRQDTNRLQNRPDELDWAESILGGISER